MHLKIQLAIEFLTQLREWFVGLDNQHVDTPFRHIVISIDQIIQELKNG